MKPSRAAVVAILALLSACGEVAAPDSRANPRDAAQVALGAKVYAQHCAACHGAKLEGQPSWRSRPANGRMPAPPHDESGHTWHHTEEVLFGITKEGLVPGKYAPPGYTSDMPAYANVLSDAEIWAVLAYIKSHWKTPALLEAREEMVRNAKRR
jgi:mono/diheme cytochrome c family protein